jgi:NhaA family Na+:H+ antiporter
VTPPAPPARRRLFDALTPGGESNLLDTLRSERTGGVLLLLGTVVALVWANSRWADSYEALGATVVGPASLHLDLTLSEWATDGLLAIFFFVVGLELKREIVVGELREFRTAVVPAVAAVGGMVVPAAVYLAINLPAAGGAPEGWAVPTATDIAFAIAVLGVVGRGLPDSLRAFLLTLAVVDDLLAILVIAVVYSGGVRGPVRWLLPVLALAAWAAMHSSGVHATIAGVALGLVVPALPRPGSQVSEAEELEHRWRPLSAGVAVPVFALFAAGVPLTAASIASAAADPVAQGVVLGLVVGKPLGIVGATWLVARFTRAGLAPGLRWWDVVGVGVVGGIGFTVSLLVGELAFGAGSEHDEHVKVAVLVGSLMAAVAGAAVLAVRGRAHRAAVADAPGPSR